MNQQRAETQTSYDRIADEYARQIYGELAGKPLDRAILDRFAERLRGRGVVCDMGCGPGQIGRYLADRGLRVVGVGTHGREVHHPRADRRDAGHGEGAEPGPGPGRRRRRLG